MKFTWPPFCLYVVADKKGGRMTINCEFHDFLLIFLNMKFVTV